MIKVEVRKVNEKITSLSLSGHAGSGEYGHDLVCAAVSAIFVGGCSALENQSSFTIQIKEGNSHLKLKDEKKLSKHDEIVLETVLIQLRNIEQDYKKFIKIEIL